MQEGVAAAGAFHDRQGPEENARIHWPSHLNTVFMYEADKLDRDDEDLLTI